MNSFQLAGLPVEPFSSLFLMSDAELMDRNIHRVFATTKPGYPCRVSLADAEVGQELLLLSFEHQPGDSPYRSSGPISVRKSAVRARLERNAIPASVRDRLISVRAYDAAHLMAEAAVCAGADSAAEIRRMFQRDEVAYIHLHNANRGCIACAVNRA